MFADFSVALLHSSTATGSLDLSIILWDLSKDAPTRIQTNRAHIEGVTKLAFLGNGKLVSGGADSCLRVWSVP